MCIFCHTTKIYLIAAMVWLNLSSATVIRYTPTKVLLANLQSASLDKEDTSSANEQYHEQDSDGFYSYGYSADRSTKAEYLTLDGSSRGFYSYIDADGKLQTVKYEAGREQGFKVVGTNLPKAPKTPNRQTPVPVKDTPEVREAKKAHFVAYREAELRAELASEKDANEGAQKKASRFQEPQKQQQEIAEVLESTGVENDLNGTLTKVNNDDDVQSQKHGATEENVDYDVNYGFEQNYDKYAYDENNRPIENTWEDNAPASDEQTSTQRHMRTYKLVDSLNEDNPLNTQALYTFDGNGESSKDLLQLTDLENKSELSLTRQCLRAPLHICYAVLKPQRDYIVATPTTFQSVPRKEALEHAHSLPVSLSTSFTSHRPQSN